MADGDKAIEVELVGGVSIVTLLDRSISEDRVATIREAVFRLIESGRGCLVFDLSRVEYLPSSLLGVLLTAKKRAVAQVCPSRRVAGLPREVVPLTAGERALAGPMGPRFRSRVFEIYPDRQSAIGAMSESGPAYGWVVLCGVRSELMEIFRVC
jgi:hypothetical protein